MIATRPKPDFGHYRVGTGRTIPRQPFGGPAHWTVLIATLVMAAVVLLALLFGSKALF